MSAVLRTGRRHCVDATARPEWTASRPLAVSARRLPTRPLVAGTPTRASRPCHYFRPRSPTRKSFRPAGDHARSVL